MIAEKMCPVVVSVFMASAPVWGCCPVCEITVLPMRGRVNHQCHRLVAFL